MRNGILQRMHIILATLFITLLLAGAVYVLTGAVYAEEAPKVDYTDNGLPVLSLTIDADEFNKVNESDDHSYKAEGASIRIDVPEGFRSECVDTDLPSTTGDIALEYIRGRGNSTWQEEKRPYKIKLDKKTDLLGMGKNKHFVLVTNYDDDSLLNNRLVLYMGRKLGLKYTPKCVPVEFVVNGRYLGSYLLCEDVRIDKNRIAIDELTDKDVQEPEITGGYLLAMCPYDDAHKVEPLQNVFQTKRLVSFKADSPEFWSDDPAEQDELGTKEQREYIESYIQKVEDAIFADDFTGEDGVRYSDLMDIESTAKYWWIQEFIDNGDAFATPSTYLYKERNGKLFWGPLWDFDLAMADVSNDEGGYDFDMNFTRSSMLWLNRLRGYEPEYQEQLRKTWEEYDAVLEDIIRKDGVLDTMLEGIKKSWEDDRAVNIKMDHDDTAESDAELVRKYIRDRRNWVNANIKDKLTDSKVLVTFMADGNVIEKRDWVRNQIITDPPEAPAKDGMTFTCWKKENGDDWDQDSEIEEDTVLTAGYVNDSDLKKPEALFFGAYDVWADIHKRIFRQNYTVEPFNADDKNVKWETSDKDVAEPYGKGYLMLKKTGTCTIKGTIKTKDGDQTKEYTLHVFDGLELGLPELPIPEVVTPEKTSITLKPGEVAQIKLDQGEGPHINYPGFETEDTEVIEIDENGVIKAVGGGRAVVKVVYKYYTEKCSITVNVVKLPNSMKASGRTVKIKAGKLRKSKKTVKGITVKKHKGKVTYKKLKVTKAKYKKYFTVNKKTGKITVKKGLKKGTYRIKVRVYDKGNGKYKAKKKNVTVKIRVV